MASRVNLKMTGDDFKGIKNLKENLAKLKSMHTKVGILGRGNYPDGMNVGDVAMIHEFGTLGTPARSFLGMPIRTRKLKVVGDKELMTRYVIYALQTGHVNVPLEHLGFNAESVIQEAFESRGFGQWAPNAPSTIAKKGSDSPLIDTARLRQSIKSMVAKRSGGQ